MIPDVRFKKTNRSAIRKPTRRFGRENIPIEDFAEVPTEFVAKNSKALIETALPAGRALY